MAGREHEAVAIGPMRMRRIEFQEFLEQDRGHVGHAHGQAGMARLGLFHRIHGQRANGVGKVALRHGGRIGWVHVGLETGRRDIDEGPPMVSDWRRNMPLAPQVVN